MFDCSKCGICCCHIHTPLIENIDGVCVNYNKETKLCNIYETRPNICRVEEGYDLYFKDVVNYEDYIKLNYQACQDLKDMFGEIKIRKIEMPSKSNKQHKFMEAVAHNKQFAKKAGISQKVGKEFVAADKKKGKGQKK